MNPRKPNRLIHEKSPYLLQHAHNPVDWYPWGEEAFEKARREDKPIFLSIGYSTCYWCHVMEREVFENPTLAEMMNRFVVSIKVDREERPDVDRVYMAALQAMSGSGGWPMSMFLTPDLMPFFGATYIPPTSRHGRAGFGEILEHIHALWTTDRKQIEDAGNRLGEYLDRFANPETKAIDPGKNALDAGFFSFLKSYDIINAGFGSAPKFPRPVVLNFLLRYHKRTGDQQALEISLETLRRMARGGMYDHIGGGFHRYATDARWHVPHFEKMLYDQAQLAISYLEAFQITDDEFFADVSRDTLEYVLRVMTRPKGGFYSAEDAESIPTESSESTPEQKEEGAFYVWTKREIDEVLSPIEAGVTCRYFGIEDGGNVSADPHGVFRGKNILHIVHTREELAKQFELSPEEVSRLLEISRRKLFEARERRPRCHLDDKILTSWNGLMISAFARAFQVLDEPRYRSAAEGAARFILENLQDESTGLLLHRYREGDARFEAHLDDYAFFIQGLLDLYEASFDIRWLTMAITLTEQQVELFYDAENGGFFDTSGRDKSILARTKEWYDGAEPTGNSVALLNLLRLSQFTNSERYGEMARKSLAFFGQRLSESPQATPQFLCALDFSLTKPKQIIIAGKPEDPLTKAILHLIHSSYIPNKIIMMADGGEGQKKLSSFIHFIGSLKMLEGRTTAYVCEDYACRLPTSDLHALAQLIEK